MQYYAGLMLNCCFSEGALLSDKKTSDGADSTHISEVSLTTTELVPDVKLHQDTSLDKGKFQRKKDWQNNL